MAFAFAALTAIAFMPFSERPLYALGCAALALAFARPRLAMPFSIAGFMLAFAVASPFSPLIVPPAALLLYALLSRPRISPRLLLLYDGDCGFCTRAARAVGPWLEASGQISMHNRLEVDHTPEVAPYLIPESLDLQIHLIEYSQPTPVTHLGFYAYRRALDARAPWASWMMWLPFAGIIGQRVYEFVARRRNRLSPEGCSIEVRR
jgi:hypothetical protein